MPAEWAVAGDIAARIADLRRHLGLKQQPMAELFGRGWKQVSSWENGRQDPPVSVLELAARQHGWPLEIFAEGGPMPSAVVNRPLTGRAVEGRVSPGPKSFEALEGLWRQITREMAEYERRGQAAPTAQLALWLERLGATSGDAEHAGVAVKAQGKVAGAKAAVDAHPPQQPPDQRQTPGG